MKIVEALKRLRVIEKRMEDNCTRIQKYASLLSIEKPTFSTEDEQRREIKSFIQSNIGLMNEYLLLKKRTEKANLEIEVEIDGYKYALSDLLIIKRKLAQNMIKTYQSLNETEASGKLARSFRVPEGQAAPHVVRLYDEKEKNTSLDFWQNMRDNIDSRIEVINSTTDLPEYE